MLDGGYEELIQEVFDMEVNVRKVIEVKKRTGEVEAYFVATVLEKKPAAIPLFAEVKIEVIEVLKEEKAQANALADAQSLFNQSNGTGSLEELLKKYSAPEGLTADRLSVQESNLFSLSANSNYIAGMGNSAEAMFAAFRMKMDEIGDPFKGSSSVYIVQLIERQESDVETFQMDPAEKDSTPSDTHPG